MSMKPNLPFDSYDKTTNVQKESDTVTINCEILRESNAAILICAESQDTGDMQNFWIPLSQVTKIVHGNGKDRVAVCGDKVTMARWLANNRGLI